LADRTTRKEEDKVAKRRSSADAADEFDDALDSVREDEATREDEPVRETAGGGDADKPRGGVAVAKRTGGRGFGFGPIGRLVRAIARFIREVVAELRKVIWPTRKELITYSVVVVFFVAVMMTIIAGFDTGFGYAVNWVFGE
jgi:preprotein translocase subunit SecE